MCKSKKYRDIANRAFRSYAALGCPTRQELEDRIITETRDRHAHTTNDMIERYIKSSLLDNRRILYDIESVNDVMLDLKEKGLENIIVAIREVYFADPTKTARKGELHDRVVRCATKHHADVRTVYRWLGLARRKFFEARGMNTSVDEFPARTVSEL